MGDNSKKEKPPSKEIVKKDDDLFNVIEVVSKTSPPASK